MEQIAKVTPNLETLAGYGNPLFISRTTETATSIATILRIRFAYPCLQTEIS